MSPKNKKKRRELKKLEEEFSNEVESDINKEIQQIKEMSTDKLPDDGLNFDFENDDHRPLDEGTQIY